MHGHGDEERAELASAIALDMSDALARYTVEIDRHTLAVEHCAGTRVVTEPVRLET